MLQIVAKLLGGKKGRIERKEAGSVSEQGVEFARALADKTPAYFSAALSVMAKEIAVDFLSEELPLRTVQDLVAAFHDSANSEYRRIHSGFVCTTVGRA